jgi:hypothetical protein
MAWAIRRRNGGIDGNEELLDESVASYGEWIDVAPLTEVEALREALEDIVSAKIDADGLTDIAQEALSALTRRAAVSASRTA